MRFFLLMMLQVANERRTLSSIHALVNFASSRFIRQSRSGGISGVAVVRLRSSQESLAFYIKLFGKSQPNLV